MGRLRWMGPKSHPLMLNHLLKYPQQGLGQLVGLGQG